VYLTQGYDESDRSYPTAYVLHAYGDTAEGLVTPEGFNMSVQAAARWYSWVSPSSRRRRSTFAVVVGGVS
jgi:hypothetical protein